MEELEGAISCVTKESPKNKLLVEQSLRTISFYAQSRGLLPDQIEQLLCHIGSCQKGGAWVNSIIIRALIPANAVPGLVVIKAVCYLGLKQIAMSTKLLLLKWIILVFNVIDDLTPLHSLYGVILNYVIVDELRSLICQLLYYLTRQEDVKPYRAQKLLQIRQRVGDEGPLNALLMIYQLHSPHLVPITLKAKQKKWFNHFEKTLSDNIAKVQKLHSLDISTPSFIKAKNDAILASPKAKRMCKELDVVFPKQLEAPKQQKSYVLTPLVTFRELMDNVDKMQFPSQMATILEYPVMQQLLSVTADKTASIRLTNWLQGVLLTKVIESHNDVEIPWIQRLLHNLVSLSHLLLEPIPILEMFLADYLQLWNGETYQREILQLISCSLHLQHFQDLQNDFLDPIKKLICISKSLKFKYLVLQSFVELLQHFVIIEWPRYHRYLQEEDHSAETFNSVFIMEYPDDLNPKNMITGFICYVDEILIHCLQLRGTIQAQKLLISLKYCKVTHVTKETLNDPFIQAVSGDFHHLVAKLPCRYKIPVFILPRAEFHFHSLFSLNGMAVTTACRHLLQFKKSLDVAKQWPVADRVSTNVVKQFNCTVLDFCNALWRCLVFAEERQSMYESLGFPFSREYLIATCKISNPSEKLHITQHVALLGYVISFLAKIQTGKAQIHPASITHQGQLKQAYFDYLVLNHMDGIVDFINTFTSRN